MTTTMPTLDIDQVEMTADEREIAEQIIRADGSLYASKPKTASGEAKYLWRMVAFGVSPNPRHHCIPVTADFDLDGTYDERREAAERLDELTRRIENTVPPIERHGLIAWGRAMGTL